MSTPLRFMEARGQPVGTQADAPSPSSPGVILRLRRVAPVSRPVEPALALKLFGLRLRNAHGALDRIVADKTVLLTLHGPDRSSMIARLSELGVAAE